jgi:hypothetical protein
VIASVTSTWSARSAGPCSTTCWPTGACGSAPGRQAGHLQVQRPRPNINPTSYKATLSIDILASPPD